LLQGNEVVSIEFAVIQENTSFVLMEATQAMGGPELISGGGSRTALVHMSISSADAASLKALFRCPWASPCDKFAFKQKLMEASDEASVKFVFDTVRKDGHPFLLYHNFDAWCTDEWLKYYSVAECSRRNAATIASNRAAAAATKPRKPKPRPPSGFYGVHAKGGRWEASLRTGPNSKKHYLGSFGTKQEAALAYDRKARQCEDDTLLNYGSIKAAEEAAAQAQAEHVPPPKQQQKRNHKTTQADHNNTKPHHSNPDVRAQLESRQRSPAETQELFKKMMAKKRQKAAEASLAEPAA
jgi:hypothetical protein